MATTSSKIKQITVVKGKNKTVCQVTRVLKHAYMIDYKKESKAVWSFHLNDKGEVKESNLQPGY